MEMTSVLETPIPDVQNETMENRFMKRVLDIAVSLPIFLLSLPVLAIIALAIKLDSPGSAFFLHERTGIDRRKSGQSSYSGDERRKFNRFGKQFRLVKFRTMYQDAPERFPELYSYQYSKEQFDSLIVGQPFVGGDSGQADPRVTRVGNFLRKTSLDELPNFINVLQGSMSVVGPRPDIWQHIRYYPESHLEKLKRKPGVTCIAQIKGRGKLTFLKTNEYDLEYIRKQSVWTDLRIIAKTVKTVLTRDGAY